MEIKGILRKDKVTKNLTKRLNAKDIALIDHRDIDEVAALSLVEKKIGAIINLDKTISGKYPNKGPMVLLENNIPIYESEKKDLMDMIEDGSYVEIINSNLYFKGDLLEKLEHLDENKIEKLLEEGRDNLDYELDKFIENTLEYAKKEKSLVTGGVEIPAIKTNLSGEHVLVVVRGQDYKRDFMTIKNYIKDIRPILVGVDGGADAILEFGFIPDIIIGDMDSVSDKALKSAKEIVVHAYRNGNAPGLNRVRELGIEPVIFQAAGTSEDIALLLAYENNADLIVALGTHNNMIDFLEKDRKGMASTFLVRLKVGEKLVDAKGVNKLYKDSFKKKHLWIIVIAALIPIIILSALTPVVSNFFKLIYLNIKLMFM